MGYRPDLTGMSSVSCVTSIPSGVYSTCVADLFELVLHTSDHHWELESRKTAYFNVDQSAETPCPSRMISSKYMQNYTHFDYRCRLPVRTTNSKGLYPALLTGMSFAKCDVYTHIYIPSVHVTSVM